MPVLTDMVGRKFEYWTVLRRGPNNRWRKHQWYCRCKCGRERLVDAKSLLSGMSKSCGCRRGLKNTTKRCVECYEIYAVRSCNKSRSERCPICRYQRNLEISKESRRRCRKRIRNYLKRYCKENSERINMLHRKKYAQLTDAVVRTRFKRDLGIPGTLVTPKMIEMKRQAMIANRVVRKLWKEMRHGA